MTQVILSDCYPAFSVFVCVFKLSNYCVMSISTGIINLKASKTHKNKFERGMIDEFTVEAVDIGPLKKLCIGHDNCGTVGQTSHLCS